MARVVLKVAFIQLAIGTLCRAVAAAHVTFPVAIVHVTIGVLGMALTLQERNTSALALCHIQQCVTLLSPPWRHRPRCLRTQ